MMSQNVSKAWLLTLGAALGLFAVQPWSPQVLGIVPLQVLLVWVVLGWYVLGGFHRVTALLSIFSKFQWLVLLFLFLMIGYRCAVDLGWLLFAQCATGLALGLCAGAAVAAPGGLRILLSMLSIAAVLSAIVAVLQQLGLADWSWQRTMYVNASYKPACGLEVFPVSFSYSVVGICVCSIVASLNDWEHPSARLGLLPMWWGAVVGILTLVGMVAAVSRSGVLGVFVALALYWWLSVKLRQPLVSMRFPVVVALSFMLVFGSFFVWSGWSGSKMADKIEGASSDMRIYETWAVFLPVLQQYPLGIPKAVIDDPRVELSRWGRPADLRSAFRATNWYMPHNWLLTTGVYYGPYVALAFLSFLIAVLVRAYSAIKMAKIYSGNTTLALTLVMLLSVNVGLLTHSWFHNSTLLVGEMRWWAWLGALCSLTALQFRKRSQ